MKSNLKFDNKNFIAEVSISNMMEDDEMAGERMRHRKSHRGKSLINTYGLETIEGGRRTYHKEGKEFVKRTRKPSEYNMFVKKYILGHKGATISEAAAAWRSRK
jgi:hypothetical protein